MKLFQQVIGLILILPSLLIGGIIFIVAAIAIGVCFCILVSGALMIEAAEGEDK